MGYSVSGFFMLKPESATTLGRTMDSFFIWKKILLEESSSVHWKKKKSWGILTIGTMQRKGDI